VKDLYGEPLYNPTDLKEVVVGLAYQLWVNQGWREAAVLAILDKEALLEYQMPNGSTSLRIVPKCSDLNGTIETATCKAWRSVSYWRVPRKWLRELAETGEPWIGTPQQSVLFVPDPAVLLAFT